ncbi:Stalked cell differentiation-controlling protein [Afipia felis]|uniref:diguanylate cyclase n=2 Tax=Afipia felis TaxID=1035 RepID=A0A380WAG2_AFIFE|nr:diguanylate cyclase (GGDEF) domain-containing protein [Afipia felis ATCC 53690]SUU77827.1 Stalked cell differentiation-controlling protein [Afipia felis]SUU85892.1 Stalked cell differentiation-controlling protein [Afipia felis]
MLDYNSLLVALSFCSAGLAFTFFVSWLVSRADRELMTWGIGVSCLAVSLFFYRNFVLEFSPNIGVIAFSALLVGLALFMGSAYQFQTGKLPVRMVAVAAGVSIALMSAPMLHGYDGISYIVLNVCAAAMMLVTAWEYWRWRAEAPLLILLLSVLYALTGLSFVLCAVVLLNHGEWVMHRAPSGWAENINLVMSITSIGGLGALSLALNQVRIARYHQREAETDALTGLFNRRALFERSLRLRGSVAVVVFDIDHFKQVNDRHGHQVGDTVLQTFASLLAANVRDGDLAARLGGEEFVIILPDTTTDDAAQIAERIRQNFAAQQFISSSGNFAVTVSAGIAGGDNDADIIALLRQADTALYDAKRSGRNRVLLYSEDISLAPSGENWTAPGAKPESVIRLRQ